MITQVDARGLSCPEPMVRARLALNAALPGEVIEVLVTDALAPLDLEALCARTDNEYCGMQPWQGEVLVVRLRKSPVRD